MHTQGSNQCGCPDPGLLGGIHTHIHTYTHTYIQARIRTHTQGLTQRGCSGPGLLGESHRHRYTCTHIHTLTHIHSQGPNQCGLTDPGLLGEKFTHTHTHTHTYTHTHTHTYTLPGLESVWLHGSWPAGRDTRAHTCIHTHTRTCTHLEPESVWLPGLWPAGRGAHIHTHNSGEYSPLPQERAPKPGRSTWWREGSCLFYPTCARARTCSHIWARTRYPYFIESSVWMGVCVYIRSGGGCRLACVPADARWSVARVWVGMSDSGGRPARDVYTEPEPRPRGPGGCSSSPAAQGGGGGG